MSAADDSVELGAFTYWDGWERDVIGRLEAVGAPPSFLGGTAGAGVWVPASGLERARRVWAELRAAHPGQVILAGE